MSTDEQTILKTEVHASIGMTIEVRNDDGTSSWLKSDVGLNVHVGPGFPEPHNLKNIMQAQVLAAMEGSRDQIDLLVEQVNKEIERR